LRPSRPHLLGFLIARAREKTGFARPRDPISRDARATTRSESLGGASDAAIRAILRAHAVDIASRRALAVVLRRAPRGEKRKNDDDG